MNQRYYNGTTQIKSFLKYFFKLFLSEYLQYTEIVLYICYMKQEKKKETFCTNLRISRKLETAIKKELKNTKRSLNGEIEYTLEQKYL